MSTANLADRRSVERLYPRPLWEVEAGENSRGSTPTLRGVLIESRPDAQGDFTLRPATKPVGEAAPDVYAVFVCPYMGKAYDAFAPGPGHAGQTVEKHGARDGLDADYARFIDQILDAARNATLQKIPGKGDRLPMG